MSEKCQIGNEPMREACCCNCRYHLPEHAHCTTVVDRGGGCVCNVQKGWACVAPEFGVVYSNWPEHGLCECWDPAE